MSGDEFHTHARAIAQIVMHGHGHGRSLSEQQSVDADGRPLPMFSYPAIEYLGQLDLRGRAVFEYGSGDSTLYWCARAGRVVTVEHDQAWFDRLASRKPPALELLFVPDETYARTIAKIGGTFDIVVIDGIDRYDCAGLAPDHLAPGGMIILDNAEWHPATAERLRKADLIEIDMNGFSPRRPYCQTTSLFLRRDFNFKPADLVQPALGIGNRQRVSSYDRPRQR